MGSKFWVGNGLYSQNGRVAWWRHNALTISTEGVPLNYETQTCIYIAMVLRGRSPRLVPHFPNVTYLGSLLLGT